MAQGVLPFQYQEQSTVAGLTALAGLPTYLDLAQVSGLRAAIQGHLSVRGEGTQGWTDSQVVMALILLNLAGGDCIADIDRLEADEGLCQVMQRVEHHGLPRGERRALARRWRKERSRTFPSPSAVFRYLAAFHDPAQEARREPHTAFIHAPNQHLRALAQVNRDFVAFVQGHSPQPQATLDRQNGVKSAVGFS